MVASLYDCDTCGGYFGSAKGIIAVEYKHPPETQRYIIRLKKAPIHFEKEDGIITGFTLEVNGQTVRADGMYQGPDGKYCAETNQQFQINGNPYVLKLRWELKNTQVISN